MYKPSYSAKKDGMEIRPENGFSSTTTRPSNAPTEPRISSATELEIPANLRDFPPLVYPTGSKSLEDFTLFGNRTMIVGKTGSGKTYYALKKIQKEIKHWDAIFVFTKEFNKKDYEGLIRKGRRPIIRIFTDRARFRGILEKISTIRGRKILIVFDDIMDRKMIGSELWDNVLCNYRHHGIDLLYIIQDLGGGDYVSSLMQNNVENIILFALNSPADISRIAKKFMPMVSYDPKRSDEYNARVNRMLYLSIVAEPYGHVVISLAVHKRN